MNVQRSLALLVIAAVAGLLFLLRRPAPELPASSIAAYAMGAKKPPPESEALILRAESGGTETERSRPIQSALELGERGRRGSGGDRSAPEFGKAIAGIVLWPDGTPASGAFVQVATMEVAEKRPHGRFRRTGLPAGTVFARPVRGATQGEERAIAVPARGVVRIELALEE